MYCGLWLFPSLTEARISFEYQLIKLAFLSFHILAQCLFPVLYTPSLVILQFILHERSAVFCSFDLYIYRLLHRLSMHQSYTCIYSTIETSMNYLTLTFHFTKSWLFFDILCVCVCVFHNPFSDILYNIISITML